MPLGVLMCYHVHQQLPNEFSTGRQIGSITKYYIPTNITMEHIIRAIKEVDKTGYDKKRESRKYDILFNGKRYPPKVIITVAKFANGQPLDHTKFSGGESYANKFLQECGFQISQKSV